jgi:hypothetical protein
MLPMDSGPSAKQEQIRRVWLRFRENSQGIHHETLLSALNQLVGEWHAALPNQVAASHTTRRADKLPACQARLPAERPPSSCGARVVVEYFCMNETSRVPELSGILSLGPLEFLEYHDVLEVIRAPRLKAPFTEHDSQHVASNQGSG